MQYCTDDSHPAEAKEAVVSTVLPNPSTCKQHMLEMNVFSNLLFNIYGVMHRKLEANMCTEEQTQHSNDHECQPVRLENRFRKAGGCSCREWSQR